jgi:hypothetical protein
VRSRCASPPYSTDVHAAPKLDQIEKVEYMFDAVVLGKKRALEDGNRIRPWQ